MWQLTTCKTVVFFFWTTRLCERENQIESMYKKRIKKTPTIHNVTHLNAIRKHRRDKSEIKQNFASMRFFNGDTFEANEYLGCVKLYTTR